MSPGMPGRPFDGSLPNVVGPVISYSAISRAVERAKRTLDSLAESIVRPIHTELAHAGQVGAAIETKVLSSVSRSLTEPEALLNDLAALVQNDIAGKLAPAVALLQDYGVLSSPSPAIAPGVVTAVERPALSGTTVNMGPPFVQSGDASKGIGGGALSPQEQELGVDPKVEGATVTITGGENTAGSPSTPSDPCPIDSILHDALQSAIDNIGSQSKSQGGQDQQVTTYIQATDFCCFESVAFNNPSQANPPIPPERLFVYQGWNSSLTAALDQASAMWPQWNALGQCGGGGPPTTPIQAPIINIPISGPPPPPPPPPQCCPPPPPCPPCPSLVLPECVQIDLCDWEKLCDILKRCIKGGMQESDCALDNETAYVYKDCDGTFGDSNTSYYGSIGGQVDSINSLDDTLPVFFNGFPYMPAELFLGPEPVVV